MKHVCKYCQTEKESGNALGGHTAFCIKNPNINKNKKTMFGNRKFERIRITKNCLKCKKTFNIIRLKDRLENITIYSKERKYCSRKCANSRIQTAKMNMSRSSKLSGKMIKERPFCSFCKIKKVNKLHKKYCSPECFENDRRQYFTEYKKYKIDCQFKFNIWDYPQEFDLDLIKRYGIYAASNRGNNLMGVSRDHIVSISYGFKYKIPIDIISHPANCKLLRHPENSSKHSKNGCAIEKLYQKIEEWNMRYNKSNSH